MDAAESTLNEWGCSKASKVILWNGPVGVVEMEKFAVGTKRIATMLADVTKHGVFTLVGGGDSVAAVTQMGFADKVSYVSTGGGAMLEYLEELNSRESKLFVNNSECRLCEFLISQK